MPTVTIDGVVVKVEEGSTILDAARETGIWIPTLCYNPSVSAPAVCRLCMVELERGKRKQLVTACNYPVRSDIKVSVSSKRAVRARRGVMELLLARAPESEELKELAARMGVEGTPYPKVTESQRNCILCGLCTSVCEEVIGCSAIGFAGRGVDRAVATPFRLASDECIACGACAVVCPVGTIQLRIHEDTGEVEISPFKSRAKLLFCEECGRRMVTEPLAKQILSKVKIDWEEFRERARLCPECRRKKTAEALGLIASKSH
ncbi:MAG: (2Fe-2S)-binding protein [Spirochaetota bacterium]|nr:MAG: (2Fe-2S)-binding protein [Spirochaetota bacterium]